MSDDSDCHDYKSEEDEYEWNSEGGEAEEEDEDEDDEEDAESGYGMMGGSSSGILDEISPVGMMELDVAEVNALSSKVNGFSAHSWIAGSSIHVCLGFNPPHELTAEQCLALGIRFHRPIQVELIFNSFYLQDTRPPIVHSVTQGTLQFALSWMIKDRLQQWLRQWPLDSLQTREDARHDRYVADLVSAFHIHAERAMYVLQKTNFNYVDSTLEIMESNFPTTTEQQNQQQPHPDPNYFDTTACKNIFVQMTQHIDSLIQTAHKRCIICDSEIEHAGLRPGICSSAICSMSYEEMGVGIDVAAEIRRDPAVMDLLVTALYSAAHGGRIELAFPDLVFEMDDDDAEKGRAKEQAKDVRELQHVLRVCPAIDQLIAMSNDFSCRDEEFPTTFRQKLDSLHPKLYPLLQWLITSTRAHIRPLRTGEILSTIDTTHQFVLLTAPIEKERQFQALKEKHGSIYAFHGSGLGNWHSILRNGLRNYSHTKYMSAGAAYGVGVYFAKSISTSIGYCNSAASRWPLSRFGNGCTIMALCEIINCPSDFTTNSSNIVVVPKDEYIITRYLLVNPRSSGIHAPASVPPLLDSHEVGGEV